MQGIINFFSDLVDWFFALCMAIVNTFAAMLQDLMIWIIDQCMSVATYVLELIDFDFLTDGSLNAYFDDLPSEVLNVTFLLGLHQAMGIIVAAVTIRLILQLIPFTRLGS
jgi:hypothetical protein